MSKGVTANGQGMPPEEILRLVAADLDRLGYRWALLHGHDTIAHGERILSDVDIAADVSGREIVQALTPSFQNHDLGPILLSHYDIAGAYCTWLAPMGGGRPLQFDVLHDPEGVGRLGVPTGAVLASVKREAGNLPLSTREWSVAYQVSKRIHKRQWDRLPRIDVAGLERGALIRALQEVFAGDAASQALRFLETGVGGAQWMSKKRLFERARRTGRYRRARGGRVSVATRRLTRIMCRVRHAAGFWVHFTGDAASLIAEECNADIGLHLPRHTIAQAPLNRASTVAWHSREVLPIVLRPGLATSWSEEPPAFLRRPDLDVETASGVEWKRIRRLVLETMASAVTHRITSQAGARRDTLSAAE